MRIEIWSDIACPWCYIGRRRFEKALAQFEQRDAVEVVWRSFQLDPGAPKTFEGSIIDALAETKGISREQSVQMHDHVTALAAQEGLAYHFDRVRPANSFDAHRLLHFALERGKQSEMKERIQKAYFTDGLVISDVDTLVKLAGEVGLDAVETRRVLEDPSAYADKVKADIRKAQMYGINGVPFFVLDERYGVSGAQPSEVFVQALERAWEDRETVEEK